MEWISVNDRLPKERHLVWLYSEFDKSIFLGCRDWVDLENWLWAAIDSGTYIYDGKICSDCLFDDLHVTHWMPLPEPPKSC